MEVKRYPCKRCGTKVIIRSKGMCPSCRALTKETTVKPPSKRVMERKEERSCLGVYFTHHIGMIGLKPKCQDTGVWIEPDAKSVCHLLPKAIYKSVMCNLDNAIYLHIDRHTRFDKLLSELQFAKLETEFKNVWFSLVIPRVEKILLLVTETGRLRTKFEEYINDQKRIY